MTEDPRLQFDLRDEVEFDYRGSALRGRIARCNPRNALVACEPGGLMNVPYSLLKRAPESVEARRGRGASELQSIDALAASLLRRHGLDGWSFRFDDACKRAGACNARTRTISMALGFARKADDAEIRDTLLHELAHALVGARHGHNAVWRAKAVEIGCSGKRCHDVAFSPPRFIARCVRGCWVAGRMRRRGDVVCGVCGGAIAYVRYTEELWAAARGEGIVAGAEVQPLG